MTFRITKAALLVALAAIVTAGPAEAFGRRQSACYSTPVYYYSYCCPQHPQPPVIHTGRDCVKNTTDKVLRVHITSGYGSFEAILTPGASASFWFIKDGKPRVLSAFTLDNTLVDLITFSPIDHATNPKVGCFPIIKSQPTTATREADRQRVETESQSPTPSGNPF